MSIYPGGATGRHTLLRRERLKVRVLPGAPLTIIVFSSIIAFYKEIL
jgi:hypothetical protein